MKVRGNLGYREHEMVEFRILRRGKNATSKSQPLTLGEQILFRHLAERFIGSKAKTGENVVLLLNKTGNL